MDEIYKIALRAAVAGSKEISKVYQEEFETIIKKTDPHLPKLTWPHHRQYMNFRSNWHPNYWGRINTPTIRNKEIMERILVCRSARWYQRVHT